MSRFLVYVTLVSVVVFPIAAILKPHSFREVPISGAGVFLVCVIVGVICGAIVGLLGGVISGLVGMGMTALLGKKATNVALPIIGAIGTGGIGAAAWLTQDAQASDPFLGSGWPIAGAISGALGGLWSMIRSGTQP
jgi:hypothetical protein